MDTAMLLAINHSWLTGGEGRGLRDVVHTKMAPVLEKDHRAQEQALLRSSRNLHNLRLPSPNGMPTVPSPSSPFSPEGVLLVGWLALWWPHRVFDRDELGMEMLRLQGEVCFCATPRSCDDNAAVMRPAASAQLERGDMYLCGVATRAAVATGALRR